MKTISSLLKLTQEKVEFWYWSADTLFWQVSIDDNMDVLCQRSTR